MSGKHKYREGDVFATPLRDNRFVRGVVARTSPRGGILVAAFFGPPTLDMPKDAETSHLTPRSSRAILRVGDLGLIGGSWPIIASMATWNRNEWNLTTFSRAESLTGRRFRCLYSDTNAGKLIREELVEKGADNIAYPSDNLYGFAAAEAYLTHLFLGEGALT